MNVFFPWLPEQCSLFRGGVLSVWLSVLNYPQENTSFSLSHMTSSGGTEHSYLRVYRTNITNHLPEGVLESSLVQAGSLESEQPPFLQRTPGTDSRPTLISGGQSFAKEKWGRGIQLSPGDRNTGKQPCCCSSWELLSRGISN